MPVNHLDEESICYCIGVGLDASFDFELTSKIGCKVFSYDPTPMSIEYMSTVQYDKSLLTYKPIGIWDQDKSLKFFSSTNQAHSNSVFDLRGTGKYIEVPCKKLSSLMSDNEHEHIDLLKIDIEGAWDVVLQNIINEKVSISILCVELDSPVSIFKVTKLIRDLEKNNFSLAHFEKDNYLFVQQELLNS